MKRQPWFWPIKLFLKRISGKELWLSKEIRVDTVESADWTYISNKLDSNSIVYSLGVGDSVDFDLDVIQRTGATVFAFDPTPYAMEWVEEQTLPDNFLFKPWAAAAEDGTLRLYRRVNRQGKGADVMWTADAKAGDANDYIDAPAHSIATIMALLHHENVHLLKLDVEGAEYGILDSLRQVRNLPEQLLVEYHHRFPGIGKERTAESIAMLRQLGYRIFGLSETGREVSLILDQECRL